MTRRDAYTLVGVLILACIAGFWFMLLAPKRNELTKLDTQITESESALQSAQAEARQFAQARQNFPTDYTTVARLGKAVPADPDTPSLVVQLDRAAKEAGVDFRKLTLQSGGGTEATPSTPAPAAPSTDTSAGSGATGAAGATGDAGTTGAASGTAGAAAASAPAPANATLTPTAPLGVDVGPAGLSVAKYDLVFQGSFYRMADLLHNVRALVQRRNRQLVVAGRLISVGGMALVKGDAGFPQVKATIAATVYLVPPSQGLFAGATSAGPADATAATPSPPAAGGAATAPPAAVVSP
jgi:hypothetical protein